MGGLAPKEWQFHWMRPELYQLPFVIYLWKSQFHFCCLLWLKATHMISLDSKGENADLYPSKGGCQEICEQVLNHPHLTV